MATSKEIAHVEYKNVHDEATLSLAWQQIRRGITRDALVIDCVENLDYEVDLSNNIRLLSRQLRDKSYRPTPVREVPVTKGGGLTRRVVVLDIEDAIVCQALAIELAPCLDSRMTESAFAMRATNNRKKPFRGWYEDWPAYQNRLRKLLQQDSFLVVSDITGYFDNIDLRILKELLLQLDTVSPDVVDLTMFLLDCWMYRPFYGLAMGRGIPQADCDLPRALSNFFLYKHDSRMRQACPNGYARWVDDMNFIVSSDLEGKKVIRELENSLKPLFLTPNGSKTRVLDREHVDRHFLFEENDFINDFERRLKLRTREGADTSDLLRELEVRFGAFVKDELKGEVAGNGDKVLKRYYTFFKRLNSDFLLTRVTADLLLMPQLDDKICDYLLAIDFQPEVVTLILGYLAGPENLYPSTEIRLLELLLHLRIPGGSCADNVAEFARDIVLGRRTAHNWHSKCLAVLLVGKYGTMGQVRELSRYLVNSGRNIESREMKRHLLAVSFLLASGDPDLVHAIDFCKGEHDRELSRLVHLWDKASTWTAIPETLKRKLVTKRQEAPTRKALSFRTFLVILILSRNPSLHKPLRPLCGGASTQNEDPIMAAKLAELARAIA